VNAYDADLWRRILVRKAATFSNLHAAIQASCGWQDCHLFAFRTPDMRKTIAGIPGDDFGEAVPDAKDVRLDAYFGRKGKDACIYEYDFGDGWLHEVVLEGIETHPEHFFRRLLDGAGVFPPEDCGSVPGYERCLAALADKGWTRDLGTAGDRMELLEWLGEWRPDSFDLAALKQRFDR
jgi:hypothetical protein